MARGTGNGASFPSPKNIQHLIVIVKMNDDASITSLVDKVLEEVECTESRASKMDVDDLLK